MKEKSIIIMKGWQLNQRHIYSFSDWFTEEYYIIEDDGECLKISKCYFEIPNNARKFNKKNHSFSMITNIPIGKYFFDEEESNEDQIVIYYN